MFTTVPVRRGFDAIAPLFDMIEGRGFICGGYARYCASPLLNPVTAGDVDVYCYTDDDFTALKEELQKHLAVQIETGRAVTFHPTDSGKLAYCPEVQLVKPVKVFRILTVGTPEEVLANFDFTVARASIISRTEAMVDQDFLADEKNKRLSLRNIHCPISSTLRVLKYSHRGYRITPSDILPLFLDWEDRDEDYKSQITAGLLDIENARKMGKAISKKRLTAIYELLGVD